MRRKRRERPLPYAAMMALLIAATVAAATLDEPESTPGETVETTYDPLETHYSEEREEYLRQEAEAAAKESEELQKSIEEYNAKMEQQAYEDLQESRRQFLEECELPYPFNTMSQDWSAADVEGFTAYTIPEEYADAGGYFPEVVQTYTYIVCNNYGVDYPTVVALIEKESGYQYDSVGEANDIGYMQIVESSHEDRIKRLGFDDMTNPYQNISTGVDFLAELLEDYDGNYKKALTAYQYGRNGAYKYWFSAGVEANPYAKAILKRAEEIREELKD
jgi:hypothetical protein